MALKNFTIPRLVYKNSGDQEKLYSKEIACCEELSAWDLPELLSVLRVPGNVRFWVPSFSQRVASNPIWTCFPEAP